MRSTTARLPRILRRLVAAQVVGLSAAATLAPASVRAAPIVTPPALAQVPQFLQSPPASNVFITLDNSGSMADEVLPDPDDSQGFQRAFPMPLRSPYASAGDGQPTTNLTGATLKFVGFSHHMNVVAFRSAAQNFMYYDPRTRYRPWKVADATGNILSYAEAADPATGATTALFNPVFPSRGGLNLAASTITLGSYTVLENTSISAGGDYTARIDATNAASATTPFALYYKFDATPRTGCDTSTPAASLADIGCYIRVEIKPSVANYTIPAGNQRGDVDEPGCAVSAGAMTCSYAAEFKNFANWFQYYRSRTLLARGAMGNAVADLGPGFRIGLGLLNPTSNSTGPADGYLSVAVRLGVRDFTGVNRKPFYDLLHNHDVGSSTPSGRALMEVGKYFDWKTGNRTNDPANPSGPWSNDPGAGLAEFAACRQSYHVYTTDGYWNEDRATLFGGLAAAAERADNSVAPADICHETGATPAGQPVCYRYDPNAPAATSGPLFDAFGAPGPNNLGNPNSRRFVSSEAQSLADIAMYFWYRDLQPTMPNLVTPSSANPAFWQNLSTIAVALGLTGTVTSQGDAFLQGLDNGTGPGWPTGLTPNGTDPKTADDLWHAAVNGHGQFLVANNQQELSTQLTRLLQEIGARSAIGSAAASSTAFLATGNGIFTAEISQGTWSGNVYRRELDPTTRKFKTTNAAGAVLARDANNVPYLWRASDQLAAPATRPIFTMRTGSTARDAMVAFLPNSGTAGVDTAQMADLAATQGPAADVINYVRGDRTREQSAVPPGNLRDRPRLKAGVAGSLNNVLGTFADSSPVYVRDDDFGYDFLPTGAPGRDTYLLFLRANQGNSTTSGRTATVWSGSNEGMLHAFNADTGAELFAYVPRAAIPNLPLLVDPKYQHRFIVDGVPALGDAYIAPPGGGSAGWRTVVVSSLGAGGRAVFAVDATDPANFATAGANSVYWEVGQQSLSTQNFELLGYTLGQAFIARVKDDTSASGGRWVAVFANGPESDSKRAALFVVDVETGSVVRVLDTGSGDTANPNGLSTPAPLYDFNRQLIGVYAGDLRGNVWKFDLSGANPSTWNVAFGTNPLFTTRSPANVGPSATRGQPQPIFAKPLLRRHPDGGIMVLFGTGKLISPGDRESEDVQSFYGVWDKPGETGGMSGNFRTAGSLVQQAITQKSAPPTVYTMTNLGVNYAAGSRGWFFDLGVTYNASGNGVNTGSANLVTPRERMIVPAAVLGRYMLAQSFIPPVDSCDIGGVSFMYGLNFLTGGFVGTGSFRNIAESGAVQMSGAFGFMILVQKPTDGMNPNDFTGFGVGIDAQGNPNNESFQPGGVGAFRTWRQLLD